MYVINAFGYIETEDRIGRTLIISIYSSKHDAPHLRASCTASGGVVGLFSVRIYIIYLADHKYADEHKFVSSSRRHCACFVFSCFAFLELRLPNEWIDVHQTSIPSIVAFLCYLGNSI